MKTILTTQIYLLVTPMFWQDLVSGKCPFQGGAMHQNASSTSSEGLPSFSVGKTKSLLQKWGYLPSGTDTTCQCGKENQTMSHLLTSKKLEQPAPWMTYYNVTAMSKKSQRLGAT